MDPVTHKNYFQHLQHLSSSADETNTGNASLPHLANTITQTFLEPITPNYEALNLSVTTNHQPSTITITESLIFKKLSTIVPTKASGPDTIPGWLLKENADGLTSAVCKILNSSYLENRLPPLGSWLM